MGWSHSLAKDAFHVCPIYQCLEISISQVKLTNWKGHHCLYFSGALHHWELELIMFSMTSCIIVLVLVFSTIFFLSQICNLKLCRKRPLNKNHYTLKKSFITAIIQMLVFIIRMMIVVNTIRNLTCKNIIRKDQMSSFLVRPNRSLY